MDNLMTQEQFKENLVLKLTQVFGVTPEEATDEQYYKSVALICNEQIAKEWYDFRHDLHMTHGPKKVYYLCMEYLLGRSLKNNLYNINLTSVAKEALSDFGIKLENLYECEPDAGLGNGGLGRLAACYLDALATGGYSATGYGLLYEYGIFKQKIENGWQTEMPDFWLPGGEVWLTEKPDEAFEVKFGGDIESTWQDGYYTTKITNATSVTAIPYDMYIPGKDGKGVAVLRLWKSDSPGFDMSLFNKGDYVHAIEKQAMAEAICKVLYPADNHHEGKILRLRQQYFLVSASVNDMVKRHLRHHDSIDSIPEKMAIHINDTHPTLAIPELIRVCLDDCGYSWDKAWDIVTRTFAYTNHTVMKEALECWPEEIFKPLLPRIHQIVKEIDNRFRAQVWDATHDPAKVEKMAIISGGQVRMANLCVAACHSVNGVSALHSDILKETIFKDFYELTPDKFQNVTNGIAHRRWLCQSNPELTEYLSELLGNDFVHDAENLRKLKNYENDPAVLETLGKIKRNNKEAFSNYLYKKQGILLDPDSVFDVQVKRLHEYKRQHLNAYEIISNYLLLKSNPNMDFVPRTYIFGAKAASGYYMAKKIIKLICSLADVINNDPDVAGRIKIVYIEDYRVSMAEALMPASEISEQISLAGTEASGTGNMKLMINGAITLGTMDGANVEIYESVGPENIYIFGMNADEARSLKTHYDPNEFFNRNEDLRHIVEFIDRGIDGTEFKELGSGMLYNDPYMVFADFEDYRRVREELTALYRNPEEWNRKSLNNIAGAGVFSADRAIAEYARNIWDAEPLKR